MCGVVVVVSVVCGGVRDTVGVGDGVGEGVGVGVGVGQIMVYGTVLLIKRYVVFGKT